MKSILRNTATRVSLASKGLFKTTNIGNASCPLGLLNSQINQKQIVRYHHEESATMSKSSNGSSIARIGFSAPDFAGTAVVNNEFKQISLKDYSGRWLVLLFYPLDFTFVCPTEIIAFNDRIKEFNSLNTSVVACSVDSEYSHLAWCKQKRSEGGLGKLTIPVLADITKSISRSYGVLMEDKGFDLRGLFLIDPNGVLRQITINDTPIGRSTDETLRLLKAFQFHEKHGEVCPSDWQEGKDTLKDDPELAKNYFKKQKDI